MRLLGGLVHASSRIPTRHSFSVNTGYPAQCDIRFLTPKSVRLPGLVTFFFNIFFYLTHWLEFYSTLFVSIITVTHEVLFYFTSTKTVLKNPVLSFKLDIV